MKIEIPKSIKDCTPDQLAKWLLLASGDIQLDTLMRKLEFRVQVISIFAGVSKDELRLIDTSDINDMFAHCISMAAEYVPDDPTGEVVIDGNKYLFDKDIHHLNTGQKIDLSLIESVYDDPYTVLGILYIEEGYVYNQLNDKKQVVNPISERIKAFKTDFPGDEFLNVFAFFLTTYENLKVATSILNLAKMEVMMTNLKNEMKNEMK